MICAWQEYLKILPHWMRAEVDKLGKESLQELRLRVGQLPKLNMHTGSAELDRIVTLEDASFVVNAASKYSPWAATTISRGYITATGGHRVGICGDAVVCNGNMTGIRTVTSLCIRVARDFPNVAQTVKKERSNILIIGPPGSGKTTLLRDLIRQRSECSGECLGVVDERCEIFPVANGSFCYPIGANTDILTGCDKKQAVDMLLRTMGLTCIAVDEITEEEDCRALLNAGWSGVSLLATAHAANQIDLYTRPVYKPLITYRLFDKLLVLQKDKTWKMENVCI